MAAVAEGRMNLAALQQRDPYITDIVDTASQVALYSFSAASNEWEKTSIEGTLFVYRRSASPNNGFMILNRLGLNNLIEPITKDLEFQLQDPFLLYRNAKAIYGIWFYDRDECAKVGQLMNSLLQLAIEHNRAKSQSANRQRRASESDSMADASVDVLPAASIEPRQVDIIQMLSKAHYEYDKTKGPPDVTNQIELPKHIANKPVEGVAQSTNLIRPLPVRCVSTSEHIPGPKLSPVIDQHETSPGTLITLESLFRNASINQQRTAADSESSGGDDVSESTIQHSPSAHQPRSRSVSDTVHKDRDNGMISPSHVTASGPTQSLHPLLQKLMSTEIERQQQHRGGGGGGSVLNTDITPNALDDQQHSPSGREAHVPVTGEFPPGPAGDMSSLAGHLLSSSSTLVSSSQILNSSITSSVKNVKSITTDTETRLIDSNSKKIFTISSRTIGAPKLTKDQSPVVLSSNLSIQNPLVNLSKSLPESVYRSPPSQTDSQQKPVYHSDTETFPTVPFSSRLKSESVCPVLDSGSRLTTSASASSLLTPAELETSSSQSSSFSAYDKAPVAGSLPPPTFGPDVLLSPMAFISAPQTSPPAEMSPLSQDESTDTDRLTGDAGAMTTRSSSQIDVPLSRDQLQQALIHLIKTDARFLTSIHDAYLKSVHHASSGTPL